MCVLVFAHQLPLASCFFEIKGPPILLASCKHDLLLHSTQHDVYGRFGFYNILILHSSAYAIYNTLQLWFGYHHRHTGRMMNATQFIHLLCSAGTSHIKTSIRLNLSPASFLFRLYAHLCNNSPPFISFPFKRIL